MQPVAPRLLPIGAVLGMLLLALTGCLQYHAGSVMHPKFQTVAVGTFSNDTNEPGLGQHLRQKLAESLMTDGSLTLSDTAKADAIVQGRIVGYAIDNVASSRITGDNLKNSGRSNYQTSIYRTDVDVEFEVKMPGLRRPVLEKQIIRGSAQYSGLPDLNVARDEGIRRAIQDAAQKIAAAVTEGW